MQVSAPWLKHHPLVCASSIRYVSQRGQWVLPSTSCSSGLSLWSLLNQSNPPSLIKICVPCTFSPIKSLWKSEGGQTLKLMIYTHDKSRSQKCAISSFLKSWEERSLFNIGEKSVCLKHWLCICQRARKQKQAIYNIWRLAHHDKRETFFPRFHAPYKHTDHFVYGAIWRCGT